MTQNKSAVDVLNEQKTRLSALQERRTRAQVRLENERRALEEARAEAQRLFGTSDLDQLRELFRTSQGENDRKVMDFLMALDKVEQQLADIERQTNL